MGTTRLARYPSNPPQPGDALPELEVTPDRHLTVRYAGASGDFNPIHVDDRAR